MNIEVDKPTFGTRVRVSAKLRRGADVYSHGRRGKLWMRTPIAPREAIYIGKRTLSDGKRETEDVGEGVIYIYWPERYFSAALVVFNERERPALVPWDALEVL